MRDALIQIALVVSILGGSAILTQLFAKAIYITCSRCRTLNARRRTHCRKCGAELKARR